MGTMALSRNFKSFPWLFVFAFLVYYTSAESERFCYDDDATLSCRSGRYIRIESVSYEVTKCSSSWKSCCLDSNSYRCRKPVSEHNPDYLEDILRTCEGQRSCKVEGDAVRLSKSEARDCKDERDTDAVYIKYDCVREGTTTDNRQCAQGEEAIVQGVQCYGTTSIRVHSASFEVSRCWYKSWSRSCCPDEDARCDYPVAAHDPAYMDEIMQRCDGRQTCNQLYTRSLSLDKRCGSAEDTDILSIQYSCELNSITTTTTSTTTTKKSTTTTKRPTTTTKKAPKTTTTTRSWTTTPTTRHPTTPPYMPGDDYGSGEILTFKMKQTIILSVVLGVLVLLIVVLFALGMRNCRIRHKDLKRRELAYEDYIASVSSELANDHTLQTGMANPGAIVA